ncbi:MAG: DUF3990 domain-containing protein [Eggerthellaceae bacterium]|nr:DUF3990 domain-containing protein [Eggerthellaceae bacterium]
MLLYHGSNLEVREPRILVANRALDFGAGFYTTSSEAQAARWAELQTLRRHRGVPTVTVYEFDETKAGVLSTLRFNEADGEWLDFVAQNRKSEYRGQRFDMVIGPVANDNTMPVINDYMAGSIGKETAIVLLKPQKLTDQYAFLTATALEVLTCKEVRTHD